MRYPNAHRVAVAMVALAAAGSASATSGDQAQRPQWQYRCIDEPASGDLEPVLDRWGEDGWELGAHVGTKLCLKRPRLVAAAALRACKPGCGAADHCVEGTCLPCSPACRTDERCADNGACVARDTSPRDGRSTTVHDAIDAGHWQPTREEFSAARAVLQPTIDRCGADAKEDGPAVIALTILGGGTVTATKAGQSRLSAPTLRCLEEAARALRFRPFRAAVISVDMPVTVHPSAPPAAARPGPPPAAATPGPPPAALPPSKLSD